MIEPARNCDPACLHPVFRKKVIDLLQALSEEGVPFDLFEGYRSIERQRYLYAQGRTRPGAIVTKARPGESYHQYGLAADFVLFENGKWSWDATGKRARYWVRLHQVGQQLGLEPLSFELPHLQLAGLRIHDLAAGKFPEGGDSSWQVALAPALKAA